METTTSTLSHNSSAGVGIGSASVRDIDAPPDIMWDVLTDIEGRPRIMSRMRAVERLDGSKEGDAPKVGTKFRLVAEDYVVDLTVASIRDGEYPRSIAYVGSGKPHHVANARRTHSNTDTVTVERIEGDENRCRLYLTFAIAPREPCARVCMTACSCLYRRKIKDAIEIDLDDYATYAEEKARDAELKKHDTAPNKGGSLQ